MNYYERHIGDYLKDTAHLSLLEHGIYTRLLDVYYTRESALPDDQVARLIGARSKEEKEALQAVLVEFFVKAESGWSQDRCDREIARYQEKQTKARNSANARWGAKPSQSDGNANASTNAMRTHSEGNAPNHQTPVTNNHKKSPLPPKGGCQRFENFWTAWPKSERKQDKVKCARKWKSDGLDAVADAILADIVTKRQTEKWRSGFIEAPLVYLNGRRWEDGTTPSAGNDTSIDPESRVAVEAEGVRLGLGSWDENTEQWHAYKARVRAAQEDEHATH